MSLIGKLNPIFKNAVIATAGDFPHKDYTDVNIARWVKYREGRFSQELGDTVTHLVCTREEFKRRTPKVQAALKRKKCHIVTFDWLEQCFVWNARQDENEFSYRKALAKQRAEKKEQLRLAKIEKEVDRGVDPRMYTVHTDRTYFRYEVKLTRGTEGERYILALHRFRKEPRLYWTVTKYYKHAHDRMPKIHRLNECSTSIKEAHAEFKRFFLKKTGIRWEERLMGQKSEIPELFHYAPPTGGKPVGCVLPKYNPSLLDISVSPQPTTATPADASNIAKTPETTTDDTDAKQYTTVRFKPLPAA